MGVTNHLLSWMILQVVLKGCTFSFLSSLPKHQLADILYVFFLIFFRKNSGQITIVTIPKLEFKVITLSVRKSAHKKLSRQKKTSFSWGKSFLEPSEHQFLADFCWHQYHHLNTPHHFRQKVARLTNPIKLEHTPVCFCVFGFMKVRWFDSKACKSQEILQ